MILISLNPNKLQLYHMSVNLGASKQAEGQGVYNDALLYSYRYDQLNRIKSMNTFSGLNTTGNHWNSPVATNDYKEEISYDPNGNILTYFRNGASATGINMDKMKYHYNAGNNQLNYVYDTVPAGNYSVDIDAQSANNYQYDAIGNLIKDNAEGISSITWNVYGKISSITKTSGTISYTYDASGNRITKAVGGVTTLYVRDAGGNVMSVYEIPAVNNIVQKELHIYGSSRLGMITGELEIEEVSLPSEFGQGRIVSFTRGKKYFELSNHLGNVMAVVSDKRISVTGGVYEADIVSATDYAPFGMGLVGRSYSSEEYRYSINGQEKTPEIAPNTTTAEYWQYDARIGRRWNVDPVVKYYEGPYAVFHSNPLYFPDPLGNDPPKKTGLLSKVWRGINADFYKTRAESEARKNNIDEENIIKLENSWIVINDKDPNDLRFSVFRKVNPNRPTLLTTSKLNDDVNLSLNQLLETNISGDDIIMMSLPQVSIATQTVGVAYAGLKSRGLLVGMVQKTNNSLQAYKKHIRFGVNGHSDLLNKGFHLHFDEVIPKLELALKPTHNGGIGLVQVGNLVGKADDIKRAVSLFNQAMNNQKFRTELLIRLKGAQEYLQNTFKYSQNSQMAIDKAHEINYLINSIKNF